MHTINRYQNGCKAHIRLHTSEMDYDVISQKVSDSKKISEIRRFACQLPACVFALLSFIYAASPAMAVQAPPFAASLTEDGTRFEQVGAETFRWKSVIKVYDIALHLGSGETSNRIFADIPTRLQLNYHRGFSAEDIVKGGNSMLARNVAAATLDKINDRLALINRTYRDVKPGDSYTLTYVPSIGTTLRLNGSRLVTIPGHDFAVAYFRIWLGDDPISPALRDRLLGR